MVSKLRKYNSGSHDIVLSFIIIPKNKEEKLVN